MVKTSFMLTVAEALKLEQFAGAEIIAGKAGLNKPVAWVHIASVPDAPRWTLKLPFWKPTLALRPPMIKNLHR